jgi:cell migration-inducing and hyaluronan-binding protein
MFMAQNATEFAPCRSTGYGRLARAPESWPRARHAVESSSALARLAIGWKQPNGFYYPPAFHSKNLFFHNVDLRHYVIDPLFLDGTYLTDENAFRRQYCSIAEKKFDNFSSIDRQTELTDDDGTLTGLISNIGSKETVSVNEDTFFNAPVEAPECASAIGPNAAPINACKSPDKSSPPQTAKTSPNEYVSTVVYRTPVIGGGVWDEHCTNPDCYGVPLYRQFLTVSEKKRWDTDCSQQADKTQDKCRWPFIRMSGAPSSARQTMTMNNGSYYLDTTVSGKRQKTEPFSRTAPEPDCKDKASGGDPPCVRRRYNVFQKEQTYYGFFVYARKTTVQTYRIYVGQDFDTKRGFSPGRMSIRNIPLGFNAEYPTRGITADYSRVATDGILTVKIDLTNQTELEPTAKSNFENLCQPRAFCQLSTDKTTKKTQCVSAVADTDPLLKANPKLKDDISAACTTWAAKDLDCPKAGCFGFSFTLPKGFVANDQYQRPDPEPFPTLAAKFSTPTLSPAQGGVPDDDKPSGQCYYDPTKPPISASCAIPENPVDR